MLKPDAVAAQTSTRTFSPKFLALLPFCLGLNGCVVVGASSRGGFFLWPGGFGLLFILVIVFLLMRRR